MILDARQITTLQSCPRRFLLEADYEVLRFRAKSLLDACLRKGIAAISNGMVPADVAAGAKADYLQVAANPGLDLPYGSNPYQIAKDYCAMLDTILRASAAWGLPKLADSAAVMLNSTVEWQPLAPLGADGALHRIVTIDRWTEDDLSRELHSWYVSGDIALARLPMTIHVVEIGQMRGGRRASAWARAWQHPTMPTLKLRFLHKDGTTFKGWKPVYLADARDISPEDWVARMEKEGAAEGLVRHLSVNIPTAQVCEDTAAQVMQEAARAGVLLSERRSQTWRGLPMSRGACDAVGHPCPWQHACYQDGTPIEDLGLYKIKGSAMLATA